MSKIIFESKVFGSTEIELNESLLQPQPLNEELTAADKAEIKKLISSTVEAQVKDAVKKEFGNTATEEMIVDITRNCLVQLYKNLWSKRTFWTNSIKNRKN